MLFRGGHSNMKQKNSLSECLKFIYKEVNSYSKGYKFYMPLYVILSVAGSLPPLFIPSLGVRYLSEQKDYASFALCAGILLGIYLLAQGLVAYLENKVTWTNTFTRVMKIFPDTYKKSMTCDYAFFESDKLKDLRSKADAAIEGNWKGAELMMKSVPSLLISLIGLLVYSAMSSLTYWWVFLIFLGEAVCNILSEMVWDRTYRKYEDKSYDAEKSLDCLFYLSRDEKEKKDIHNYGLIKMLNIFLNKRYTLFENYWKLQHRFSFLPNLSNSIFGFIRDIVLYSLLITQVVNGNLPLASFVALIEVINGMSAYLSTIGEKYLDLRSGANSVTYLIDYMGSPSEMNYGKGVALDKLNYPLSIEFQDVSFTYSGAKKPTIDHLSFKISPGEKIALVGENGAGKTTIIKLLSGLYKPTGGRILIGGTDINDFNISDYRKLLSVINQEVNLIGFPLDNIVSCSLDPDDKKVRECLDKAGLKDKVSSLPQKEKTCISKNLSPDGVELSGGEQQKVMLARALYKNGPLLFLDEPTSALDPIAEGELYEKYNDLTKNKTSVFISHRLSSTRFCDDILYLEKGKIIEEGTHEELMKKNGKYAEIFNLQAHYYKENKNHEEL